MRFLHVVGARPNLMKLAPVHRALAQYDCEQVLVHTGQHYDANMSGAFFEQLGIPQPDFNLNVGSGTHARQTAEVMMKLEPILADRPPDAMVIYGDVNSTLAAALVGAKLGIRLAHVEAGLRSFDRAMPEEINRVLTDQLAQWLFTPSPDGDENLAREGVSPERIHCVGNVMIDTLLRMLPLAEVPSFSVPERYILATLHRPGNVDDLAWLSAVVGILAEAARKTPVIFPVHPRTRQRLAEAAPEAAHAGILWCEPLPYLDFLALQRRATVVITDSGGIQEETTYLRIPCLTVRENTERPVTVRVGTNEIVGRDPEKLRTALARVLRQGPRASRIPALWDGHAAERIAAILASGRAESGGLGR